MKEHATADSASIPFEHDWDAYPKAKREKIVRKALKCCDTETLMELTDHTLPLLGRGGVHTSIQTRRSYRTGVWKSLTSAFPLGWERLTEYDTDLTVGYLRALEREGLQQGTINSRRSAARALYRALRWAGVLHTDPFAGTPGVKESEEGWTSLRPLLPLFIFRGTNPISVRKLALAAPQKLY